LRRSKNATLPNRNRRSQGRFLAPARDLPRRADVLSVALYFLNRRGTPSSKEGKTAFLLFAHLIPELGNNPVRPRLRSYAATAANNE
jgi:hypothetical protein